MISYSIGHLEAMQEKSKNPIWKPRSVTEKLATTRPVEPARPEVAVPGVLEPLAWDACTAAHRSHVRVM